RLTEATGRCPPEDVGGPWGYAEFLEAMNDPKHERHDELADWIDEDDFDPTAVDIDQLARSVAALAHNWARRACHHQAGSPPHRLTCGAHRMDTLLRQELHPSTLMWNTASSIPSIFRSDRL